MLPQELWRVILRESTIIPAPIIDIASLIDDWYESCRFNKAYCDPIKRRFATTTKLRLMLVCKEWYSIVIELLYEDIRPGSFEQMESLLSVLRADEQRDDVSGWSDGARIRHLGWWTKIFYPPKEEQRKGNEVVDLLIQLTSYFPNLVILSVAGYLTSSRNPGRLAQTLRNTCHSLQYLACNHTHWNEELKPSTILDTVTLDYFGIPSLHYLSTIWAIDQTPLTCPVSHARITTLRLILSFSGSLRGMDSIRLPSLRHVHLTKHTAIRPCFQRFFTIHGPHIISFCSDISARLLLEDPIMTRFTSLRDLILWGQKWGPSANEGTSLSHPSVIRLGIWISDLLRRLEPPALDRAWFPNLRVVKVMDDVADGWVGEERRALDSFLTEGTGVIYEDASGRVIQSVPAQ